MKYIDADQLKVLLSDLKENHKYYNGDFHDGVVFTVDEIEEIVDSLQQEQTEGLHFTPLNRLIQKIQNWNETVNNYANKLRDCLINEGYRKDAEVLQAYISYMNDNNVPMATMDVHEQPEVDLEKEIDEIWDPRLMNYEVFVHIARHFYELGRLNARKDKQRCNGRQKWT